MDTIKNVDAYHELANAIIVAACDDYREYKKQFRKNEDVLVYVSKRMSKAEEYTEEQCMLQMVKEDFELDQRRLHSKIAEIEKFLSSAYGMLLSHGLGDVILEKIQNEQPTAEPSAERGKALLKKKEKKMQERLKKIFERSKK